MHGELTGFPSLFSPDVLQLQQKKKTIEKIYSMHGVENALELFRNQKDVASYREGWMKLLAC